MQCCPDGFKNDLWLGQQVVVPDTEQAKALRFQIGVASGVTDTARVLTTVQLNDELFRQANEINYIVAKR